MTETYLPRGNEPVTAWRYDGRNEADLPHWVRAIMTQITGGSLQLRTRRGVEPCMIGEWVVGAPTGVEIMTHGMFDATYEATGKDPAPERATELARLDNEPALAREHAPEADHGTAPAAEPVS